MERRLAAILAADIVGYSRLMDRDESRTILLLNELQSNVIEPVTSQHGGRIFKTLGDGFLVEFTSVVKATTCAQMWQSAVAGWQAANDPDFLLRFRIGISLGEVIVQGDDLFGNGVNIAARLEALAAPGTICVTAEVYAQIAGRISVEFEDLGERELKNISGQYRVYSLTPPSDAEVVLPTIEPERAPIADTPTGPSATIKDDREGAPSIAILPFVDMDPEGKNAFLADGFSEEIAATLARTRWLFVVATGSSATFRDRTDDPRAIAADLGVKYLLQGRFGQETSKVTYL